MDWTIVIGPLENSLELADLITDIADEMDVEFFEAANSVGLNPTYSLYIGRYEQKSEAEKVSSYIFTTFGHKSIITKFPDVRGRSEDANFDPKKFVEEIYELYEQGILFTNLRLKVDIAMETNPDDSQIIRKFMFAKFKDIDYEFSIPFGIEYIRGTPDYPFFKVLSTRMNRNGMENELLDLQLDLFKRDRNKSQIPILIRSLLTQRYQDLIGQSPYSARTILEKLGKIIASATEDDFEILLTCTLIP